ncbi:CoA transferase [Nocardia wallacei]|uniref:CoA transferase n=1 Tax=Nocardia wallacei TaxID=480035 RepID=UPI002456B0A6|nr:CoA transferase [Nocardia wallacei]
MTTQTSVPASAVALLPAGTTATVTGSGATAQVLREHLRAIGATLTGSDDSGTDDSAAATVALSLGDGRRRAATVGWAGPVADPDLADETTVQAICGVMHVNGRRSGYPRGLEVDYCATAAGVLAATGLLASLLLPAERLRVDTSVAEAALLAVSQYLAAAGADDPEAVDPAPGGPPFVSLDGVRFEIESLQPEPWAAFWSALDAEPRALRKGWRPFQFRYATATAPVPQALHDATRGRMFADITRIAARSGVSVCRLYRGDEPGAPAPDCLPAPWSLVPQPTKVARQRYSAPMAMQRYSAPMAVQRNSAPMASSPLSGIRVLEAGRRVQAPLAAHLLRLLGAHVTRVEPPGGDPLRQMPPCSGDLSSRWLALNRDKAAAEFDIKSPGDRARLRASAAEADVFLHNWAPGKAEEFGLAAADLPSGLVYTYTSGWSGLDLPDLPPGTDFMVQARSGLADLVGPPDTPPAPSLMTLLDVLGGVLGAEATVLGLLHRDRTGAGAAVESSLLSASNTLRRHGRTTSRRGTRQPFRLDGRWVAVGSSGTPVPVTGDLADLPTDARFATVLGRDTFGCPALTTPWRLS